jgi:hypothetical protein
MKVSTGSTAAVVFVLIASLGASARAQQEGAAARSNPAAAPASSPLATVLGAGTANVVPLWTGSYTIQTSNLFQKGRSLGVGTTSPAATLEVNGTGKFDQAVTFASGQTFPGTASLGSNSFVGNQTITGNLAVASTGSISLGTTGGGLVIQPSTDEYGPNVFNGWSGNGIVNTTGFGAAMADVIAGGGSDGEANSIIISSPEGSITDTIGGGSANTISIDSQNSGSAGNVIAGGEGNEITNGDFVVIGGGNSNSASGTGSTIAGGFVGTANGVYAAIGGGQSNNASGSHATIGGGGGNTASGQDATVSGGTGNLASGIGATVPGGQSNQAIGTNSFAAGTGAVATADGTFVWLDNSGGTVPGSGTPNQFIARSVNGYVLWTTSDLRVGAELGPGSGSWSMLSDRNVKDHLAPVNGARVLERLAKIPIGTWNYKSQASSIRHMGPMAQDFRAAFGLGEDNKHISDVDGQGVALAGVQELYRLNLQKDARIKQLAAQLRSTSREKDAKLARQSVEIRQLTAKVKSLEAVQRQVTALAVRLDRLESSQQSSASLRTQGLARPGNAPSGVASRATF